MWGVVHDGYRPFEDTVQALTRFRADGGTVVLLSNAPVPNDGVTSMLDERGVPRTAWDAIVTSGDIALRHVNERGYRRVLAVGPQDRDAALFDRLDARLTPLADAEAIVCSGLDDDINETAETYRPLLEQAHARALPFVCANPDLVVDVGGRLYLCAGAIADLYEDMGGEVFWAGKPHPPAYDAALASAASMRGGARIDRRRVLAIGDAVRTDIAGAAQAGIDALFVASGIHRHDAMDGNRLSAARLAKLFPPDAPSAIAAMAALKW